MYADNLTAEDPRVRQSRGAVMQAFLDLVLQRRYDQLKVSEITARAGVSRSTFYEHFPGKDALLRQGLAAPLSVLARASTGEPCAADLEATVAHFWEHRRMARALLTGAVGQTLIRLHADGIERALARHGASARASQTPLGGAPTRLVCRQIAAGQIALLAAWLSGEAASTPAQIAEVMQRSATGALQALGALESAPAGRSRPA